MTPLVKVGNFYLKREDQNLTGSAKDRAISYQVDQLQKNNVKSAVISSSGNAAISAAYFCRQHQINLTIFVSPKINPHKLSLLKNEQIISSDTPIKDAFLFAKKNGVFFLRQSTDPNALLGYQQIGAEINQQLPQITSLFIPVGSGTTLLGISQTLKTKIFAIQPASHAPISSHFDTSFQPETDTITDALSVKLLPLKSRVISVVFSGLVVQNQNVINAVGHLQKNNIITSPEGALALAGLFKAKLSKIDIGDFPIVLLTGTKR